MLLLPNTIGLLPFYDQKPDWDCAPICSDTSPGFIIKGIYAPSINLNQGLGTSYLPVPPQIITIDGEPYTYVSAGSVPSGYAGTFCIELFSVGQKTGYSELFTISDCKMPYRLKAEFNCDGKRGPGGLPVEIGFDLASTINVTEEVISQENIDNGFGTSIDEYFKTRNTYTIDVWMTPGLRQMIGRLRLYDKVSLCCPDGTEIELDPSSIEPGYSPDINKFSTGTITFAYKDSWICKESCGCIDIELESEDDCDTPPEDCDFTAAVDVSGDNLTINITNPPTTTPTFTWTKNGSYITNAQSITTNGSGNYCATVNYPGCPPQTVCHTVLDLCANFNVDLIQNGLTVDGVITGIPSGDTYNVTITDSLGALVGSALPFTAPTEGNYTIKVETSSGCKQIQVIQVGESSCDWDFSVVKNGNGVLSADFDPVCSGTPSYIWYQVVNGSAETQVSTSSTYAPTETGNYILQVSCDGCTKRQSYMCIVEAQKQQIEICNWDEMPLNNQPIIINVTCGECDEDCNGQLTVKCVKNPDGTIDICSTFSEPGYTFEVCDSNNNPIGTGDKVAIPNIDATYTVKASNPDCPTITNTFEFNAANAGLTLRDQNNPIKVN